MDQPATPARYLACNRDAPRCGGGDLGRHEGPPCGGARRLICSLSTGRLEAGPGGGPASGCLEISPFMGRQRATSRHTMGQRNRTPWPQRRTEAQMYGRPTGRPFLSREEQSIRRQSCSRSYTWNWRPGCSTVRPGIYRQRPNPLGPPRTRLVLERQSAERALGRRLQSGVRPAQLAVSVAPRRCARS